MEDGKIIEITFPWATPSGWAYKGFNGWKVLMGWNKKYDRFLKGYNLVKKWQAKEKRRIEVTRYVPRKDWMIKDDVNLREGCKPLVDALVRAGLLYRDDTEWLEDGYKQEIGKSQTKVIIYG